MIGKLVVGSKAVVSDHQLATQIGMEILRRGGNAFDAAIAVSAALSVVQPQMGGPGGDAFLLGFVGDEVIAIASSGRSPSGFSAEEFFEKKPVRGPLTVTVPGLVALWSVIYEEFASMSLEELLEPAIKLAYSGFPVGLFLSEASKAYEEELSVYRWARYFKGLELGSTFRSLDMAKTLRTLATRGLDEFYIGDLAESIVSELRDQGVGIVFEDLAEHRAEKVKPLKLEVDNMVLYELPPNTQGITTFQAITALYELNLDKLDFRSPERVIAWSKPVRDIYMFRDLFIADPSYMTIDPQSYVRYSNAVKLLKQVEKRGSSAGAGDTTFFIVSDGEATIGFIQSLFYPFGSGLVAAGFPVQNRSLGFAKERGLPNSPAPRKKPLHTLSVLAIDAGEEKYIIGCVGGDYRPQLHLRVYENLFVYGMRLDRAVAAPRFIYMVPYGKQKVVVEEPLPAPQPQQGIEVESVGYGGSRGFVHVAKIRRDRVYIAADPRSEGVPLAY